MYICLGKVDSHDLHYNYHTACKLCNNLMKTTIHSAFVLNCPLQDEKQSSRNGVKKNKLAGKKNFIRFFR